jgi:hypothetical protein
MGSNSIIFFNISFIVRNKKQQIKKNNNIKTDYLSLFFFLPFRNPFNPESAKIPVEVNIPNLMHSAQLEYSSFSSTTHHVDVSQFTKLTQHPVTDEMEKLYQKNLELLKSKVHILFEHQKQIQQLEAELAGNINSS